VIVVVTWITRSAIKKALEEAKVRPPVYVEASLLSDVSPQEKKAAQQACERAENATVGGAVQVDEKTPLLV
jgi:hypothetical protein